jgi:pilus assembly protein CpaB
MGIKTMSKMRVVMFALAIGSALVAALLAKGVIGRKPEVQVTEVNVVKTTDVLVVAKDVLMGEKFLNGTLAWKSWPTDNVVPTMITKDVKPDAIKEFTDARARIAIYQGETVMDRKVLLPGKGGFMSSILPKGMRAISVAISSRSSAGGFILPDDRVDLILTSKAGQGGSTINKAVNSETVITNVRVLAVNQVYNPKGEADTVTVDKGENATIEVTPHQAEVIEMVESSGELSLALRSIAENDGKKIEEIKPKLAEKFEIGEAGKPASTDTLYLRYGVETYASSAK